MSPEHLRQIDHLNFLRTTASMLRDRGMSQGQILETLEQRNIAYGPTKLSRFELVEIVQKAMGAQ